MTTDAFDSAGHARPSANYGDFRRKIVTAAHLAHGLETLRTNESGQAPQVVHCHGCFDIVHPGHIRYLQFARSLGDILVVSMTGDARIDKQPQRPYIPEELRAENLAALEFVDWVVIDSQPTAREVLSVIKPDIYVKGREYADNDDPRFLEEKRVVESHGGRVVFSSGEVVFSSSRLIESITPTEDIERRRLEVLCQRHEISLPRVHQSLNGIYDKRILVVGDAVIERYVYCDAKRVANESPMMSLRELQDKQFAGGAALVALQLAALGAQPTLVTGVADGPESEWLKDVLDQRGVDLVPVLRSVDLPVRTRFIVDDQKLMLVERNEPHPVEAERSQQLRDILTPLAKQADALVTFDADGGLLAQSGLPELMKLGQRLLRMGGSAIAPSRLLAMADTDVLITSERKLRLEMNDLESGLSALVYRTMQRTSTAAMIVSLGKRGLVTFQRPTDDPDVPEWKGRLLSEHLPAFGEFAHDHFGCGEVLLATMLASCATGDSLMLAAYLASIAAGLAATKAGPLPVDRDDLRRACLRRPELQVGHEARTAGRVA